ncbi:hypothetical protein KQX54_006585 [Cotesia glomerata]|uniref:Odorant receptor n=1 Tax=Cotesia glomerata TaxID=32391 RepID=A0AAV7J3A2_COTGL|nr:hypothetical protein KQX54_006585 [Cotesia glomerata]
MSTVTMCFVAYALRPIIIVSTYWASLSEQSNSTFDFPIIVYPLQYPFEYQTIAKYSLLILYEELVNYSAACCLICDALYIQLMTHISINFLVIDYFLQLVVLVLGITVLADDFKNASQCIDNDVNDNKQIKNMVKLVNKHRHMLVICQKVESVYNPIVLFTIIINGLNLCFSVIVLDKGFSDGNWALVIKGFILTVAIIVQLLIYCNFSHTATEMTASIENSIYDSEWVNCSKKFKKMILMILYASKEYTFTAYGVFDLNREQLSAVMFNVTVYCELSYNSCLSPTEVPMRTISSHRDDNTHLKLMPFLAEIICFQGNQNANIATVFRSFSYVISIDSCLHETNPRKMFKRKVNESNVNKIPFEEMWSMEIFVFKMIGKPLRDAFNDTYHEESLIETIIFIIGFVLHSLFVIFSFYTLYAVECDMLFIAEIIPLLFGISMNIIKGLTLWFYRHDLFTIIRDFLTLWNYNQTKTNLLNNINNLMKSSKRVRYYYMFTVILIGTSFGLRPLIMIFTCCVSSSGQSNSTFDFSVVVYPLAYPFTYQTVSRYSLLLLYEEFVNYFAVCYVICDALYIQLMTHISINFLVLADDFNNVNQCVDSDDNDDSKIEHMVKLVDKHRQMLVICEKVESFYNPIVFFTIVMNGLDLCLCVIVIDKEISEGNWPIVIKCFVHAVALFVQIIIYCNFSHIATEMTASIENSIYNSEWVNNSNKFKKMIMMIMMRTSKEYKFTAYGILVLNREQMAKVLADDFSNVNQCIDTDDNDHNKIRHLAKLVDKHRHLLVICEKVESFYSPIAFFTIVMNGLDLCLCVIVVDKGISEGNWPIVIKSFVHAIALFVQIIMYCNFSHTATEMTASIRQSIYNSEWVNSSKKLKKMLMMIMMRASKEHTFTAYGILILNREQMAKGYTLWANRVDIFRVLQQFSILWIGTQTKVDLMYKIDPLLNISRKIRYSYIVTALFLGFSYALRPVIIMLTTYVGTTLGLNNTIDCSITAWPIEYPFVHQTISRYIPLLVYENLTNHFAASYLICDALYIQLTTYLAINFMVMADEFSNMRPYFADESDNIQHLIELVHKHRDLLSLAQKIEFTYSPVFLATIVFNGINLCLCVIIVDKEISEGEWTLLMKSLIHAAVLATQIFIYCDFSHTVTETIDSIPISLYDSEWVDSTIKLKKMLVIILMQASKQYKFTAYNIVTLNRGQMTTV